MWRVGGEVELLLLTDASSLMFVCCIDAQLSAVIVQLHDCTIGDTLYLCYVDGCFC